MNAILRLSCVVVSALALLPRCSVGDPNPKASQARAVQASLPLVFEANRGQAPAELAYLVHGNAISAGFRRDGFDLAGAGMRADVKLYSFGA